MEKMALFLDGGAGWAPPLLWIQSTKLMHFGGKGVSLPTLPPTTRNPAYYHFYFILVTLSGTYQIDSATDFLMIQQQMLNML